MCAHTSLTVEEESACVCVFYLHCVVSSLVGHVGCFLCLFDAVDDLVVGLCYIHNTLLLGFGYHTAEKKDHYQLLLLVTVTVLELFCGSLLGRAF